MRRAFLAAAISLLAAGCTTIGHEKVQGWPRLEVVEHYVPYEAMAARCQKYVGFGMTPLACAEFDFVAHRCHLWFNESFAPRAVVEHERLHCQGYDHAGESTMRDFLAQHYRAGRTRPAASPKPIVAQPSRAQ